MHDSLGTGQRIGTDDHLLISLPSSSPGQGIYEAGGISDSEKCSDEVDLLENSESFLHFETGSKVFHPGHKTGQVKDESEGSKGQPIISASQSHGLVYSQERDTRGDDVKV